MEDACEQQQATQGNGNGRQPPPSSPPTQSLAILSRVIKDAGRSLLHAIAAAAAASRNGKERARVRDGGWERGNARSLS